MNPRRRHRFDCLLPYPVRSISLGIVVLAMTITALAALTAALDPHLAARVDDVAGVIQRPPAAPVPDVASRVEEEAPPEPEPASAQMLADSYRIIVPGLARALPEPSPPPIPGAFLALEVDLAAAIAAHPGPTELGIAVTDIQTGHTIAVNGDQFFLAGCVVNLFVILESLGMAQAGALSLAEIDPWIYATTWSSNASTAGVLLSMVGGDDPLEGVRRVRVLLERMGLSSGIILDHPPAFPGISVGVDDNNWVTARAVNRALVDLYQGRVLDPAHTAFALDALATVKPGLNYLTAAGVPAGVTVSHKNGFLLATTGFVDNDAGIIRFERNGQEFAYAVTFLSHNNPVKYSEIPVAQSMMARIWDYFDGSYPARY